MAEHLIKAVKTIRSYIGLAQFLSETEPTGEWLARVQIEHIKSPYAYSPTKQLLSWEGKTVLVSEVAHKVYEVYEVPAEIKRYASDAEAADWNSKAQEE